jgi:hypothetical protein
VNLRKLITVCGITLTSNSCFSKVVSKTVDSGTLAILVLLRELFNEQLERERERERRP